VNIEVERCGDVRMTQEYAHGFIVAILRSLKAGYVRKKIRYLYLSDNQWNKSE